MEKFNIKVGILPNTSFLKEDGVFDKDKALMFSGHVAGVCYDKEGYNHIKDEDANKTKRRVSTTMLNGHHSVYDHINISLNIENIPKILAMVLNNEKSYATSEKSLRYTSVSKMENPVLSKLEEDLYNKWFNIFEKKIADMYNNVFTERKIKTLSQENARYMLSVFMPTKMIYTVSFRQINYIARWMNDYIDNHDKLNSFENRLSLAMREFLDCLEEIDVLSCGLQGNEKDRKITLFSDNLSSKEDYFCDEFYSVNYLGSFAELAQAQRHRTLNYEMEFLSSKEFFIPPILLDDESLMNSWLDDIKSVSSLTPQGELVRIHETGTYDNFILKCKERLCTEAQLEIMKQTKTTLEKYMKYLEEHGSQKFDDIKKYSKGARCTFPCYECKNDCKFKEGKTLVRKI